MIKKIVNNQKGVSLVTLTITVIVILILTGIVLYNVKDNLGVQKLKSMQADIENLRDKIESYYIEYGSIPAKIEYTNITNIKNAGVISDEVDTGDFYIIDLSAIDNLTLTYGRDYNKIESEQRVDNLEDIQNICKKEKVPVCFATSRLAKEGIITYNSKLYNKYREMI